MGMARESTIDVSQIDDKFKWVYMPEGLDLSMYFIGSMAKYIDDAKYFIHKIREHRLLNYRRKKSFTPLKSEYLKKVISFHYYNKIKEILIENNIIQCDNFYVEGEKALGYRLHYKFRSQKNRKDYLNKNSLIRRRWKASESFDKPQYDVHQYILDNIKLLDIDYHAYYEINNDDYGFESMCLERIRNKDFFLIYCPYGRVHTNITNLRTEFRDYLRLDGNRLCEIDICNSQPYFFAILLKIYLNNNNRFKSFNWNISDLILKEEIDQSQEEKETKENHDLRSSKISKITSSPLYINHNLLLYAIRSEFCTCLEVGYSRDVNLYFDLVCGGNFYEYVSDKLDIPLNCRKQFKQKFFAEVFFGNNDDNNKIYCKMFNDIFPTIYPIIQLLKKKNYKFFSRALQNLESAFIINRIVRKCMELNIWTATIHDSLLVQPHDVETVKNILLNELSETGLIPTLKIREAGT